MKRILFATALVCVMAFPAVAQDAVQIDPEHYKVEIENNYVRVVRVKRPPHDKSPMHESPDYVVVFLTDVHQKITDANGTSREVNRKAGEVAFNQAAKHEEQSLSDQPMEVVLVELKPAAMWGSAKLDLDPVKIDPKHNILEFQNDRVRVVRSIREPHDKIPMHEHLHYVAVALTDVNSMTTLPDGTSAPNERKARSVIYRDPIKHAVENIGTQRIEEVQIEMK